MYVHDVSDIFVDAMKMANYLKLEGRRGWFASEALYACTMVAWVYYRLYVFPVSIIGSTVFDVHRLWAPHLGPGWRTYFFPPGLPLFTELTALMVLLVVRVRLVSGRGGGYARASRACASFRCAWALPRPTFPFAEPPGLPGAARVLVLFARERGVPHRDGVGARGEPPGVRGRQRHGGRR